MVVNVLVYKLFRSLTQGNLIMNKLVLDLQEIIEIIVATEKEYFDYGFHNVTSLLTEDGYRADYYGASLLVPAKLESKKLGSDNQESTDIVLDASLVFPIEDNGFCFDICIQIPESCQNVQSTVGADFRLNVLEIAPTVECGVNLLVMETPNTHVDDINSYSFDEDDDFELSPIELVQPKGRWLKHTVNTMNTKRNNMYANFLHTVSIIISEDSLPSKDFSHEQTYKRIKRKLKNTKND